MHTDLPDMNPILAEIDLEAASVCQRLDLLGDACDAGEADFLRVIA